MARPDLCKRPTRSKRLADVGANYLVECKDAHNMRIGQSVHADNSLPQDHELLIAEGQKLRRKCGKILSRTFAVI
jgi:hypothetical protein